MSKNNDYLDPMLAGASASLYGLENQEAVKESFPLIYQKMVDSFGDPEFIAKLHALKGRGQTTVGINLPKKNEAFRFVNKMWFQVQKSDSEYWEIYYLNIGFNFNHSKYNPFEYQKMMIKKVALGTIDKIRERISAPDFAKSFEKKLSDYVYDTLFENALGILTPPNEAEDGASTQEENT